MSHMPIFVSMIKKVSKIIKIISSQANSKFAEKKCQTYLTYKPRRLPDIAHTWYMIMIYQAISDMRRKDLTHNKSTFFNIKF